MSEPSTNPATSKPSLYDRLFHFAKEVASFGAIGGLATIIDVGGYNLLRMEGLMHEQALGAKVVSVAVATLFAWWGNRTFTYRDRNIMSPRKEFIAYAVVNVIGLSIALACMYISREVLGYTSKTADNISGNFIGLILGIGFRFIVYRTWLFPPAKKGEVIDLTEETPAPPTSAPTAVTRDVA